MSTLLHRPLSTSFPDIPLSELEGLLASREWSTYSIGIRCRDPLQKDLFSKAVRVRIADSPLFRGKMIAFEHPDIEIILDEGAGQLTVQVLPLIITGRYTKLSRFIAQTRHYCYACKGSGRTQGRECPVCHGDKVLTKESVQELIAPFFRDAFHCDEVLFHGAGREDVDVRMLGNGRPFALTLENPLVRSVEMGSLQSAINDSLVGKVGLLDVRIGIPSDVASITRAYHTKRYRAVVFSEEVISLEKLDSFRGQKIDVLQTTPVRVEKRRVMKERPHWVILEKATKMDDHRIEIELHASAGCYIKEFISGDAGRSLPSLSEWLGIPCVCQELDVLEIVDLAE